MQCIYTCEHVPDSFEKSLFLAGPTPRSPKVRSWRPAAIKILERLGYDGVVFVPESRSFAAAEPSPEDIVRWETECLNKADCILFWVPRKMKTLPGLTTNIEWGIWASSGKAVLGAPPNAEHMEYLRLMATRLRVPFFETLEDTVSAALQHIGAGALRTAGECWIPLYIWRTSMFQEWYQAQYEAGNRLEWAEVKLASRAGRLRDRVAVWVLHVAIYVASEGRVKSNELVIGRPPIASAVLYHTQNDPLDSEIVLVREFRPAAATRDGFIWELPGGSSWNPPLYMSELACEEVEEETRFVIARERLRPLGGRQLAATLSAHKAHVFCAELTDEELAWFRSQQGVAHGTGSGEGIAGTGERTYIAVRTVREILAERFLDWSNVGMILQAIATP